MGKRKRLSRGFAAQLLAQARHKRDRCQCACSAATPSKRITQTRMFPGRRQVHPVQSRLELSITARVSDERGRKSQPRGADRRQRSPPLRQKRGLRAGLWARQALASAGPGGPMPALLRGAGGCGFALCAKELPAHFLDASRMGRSRVLISLILARRDLFHWRGRSGPVESSFGSRRQSRSTNRHRLIQQRLQSLQQPLAR